MKHRHIILWALTAIAANSNVNAQTSCCRQTLKEFAKDKFSIGVAMTAKQGADELPNVTELIKRHFNCIVAENGMKSEIIHPEKDRYYWNTGDSLVMFGQKYNMDVYGHVLIWHSQLAKWFPVDDNGHPVSKQEMRKRMKDHIYTIMRRYKGKIKGWDVVNEAIEDDGSYRKSPFYNILGEEYIPLAFKYAHEADPDAELYINDYGMNGKAKRDTYVRIVNDLKRSGLRIDAIGMQGHMGMDYPDIDEFEESIKAFAATGCNVMITEWEMSALPTVHQSADIGDELNYQAIYNPYPVELPDSVSAVWNKRMKDFFTLFIKYSDVITRVNVWGVSDGDSWKNDFPMKGRKEYPLLFDRQYRMKPFLKEMMAEQAKKNCHKK